MKYEFLKIVSISKLGKNMHLNKIEPLLFWEIRLVNTKYILYPVLRW